MGRAGIVGLLFLGAVLAADADEDSARVVAGVVRGADGRALAGTQVVLEIGRARLRLTEDYDLWESVRTDRATSGEDGGFRFADVPEGASAVVWVQTAEGFASAPGAPSVTLTPAPLGSVGGKVNGKPSLLKALRVGVTGGRGLVYAEGKVDEDTGRFDVPGVVPGEGLLHVQRGNFPVARVPVQVVAGQETRVKAVRVTEDFLPAADPLVDVSRVRLVDPEGRPVPGIQFVWSSRWGDGGMDSDAEGIVRLAGGGVAIGGPPYYLRTSTLQGGSRAFRGLLKGERGGVATVELQPLHAVSGTVSRGGKALDLYRLHAVADGKTPRVFSATLEKGRYSVHLPPGACRIVVLTADGVLHESTIEVAASEETQTRDVALP